MANITSGFWPESRTEIFLKLGSNWSGREGELEGRAQLLLGQGECELLLQLGVTVPTTVPYSGSPAAAGANLILRALLLAK